MNLSPEQMQFLADKGLSLHDVIEFAQMGARRSGAAERQARYRARLKGENVTGDVTRYGNSDVTDPALSLPPNEINNSNPPAHSHPNTKPRARKGHRLPEDWKPGLLPADLAKAVAAWPQPTADSPGALERELARFRDWAASATGPNATKLDWQAAWRNWLRKAHDEGRWKQNERSTPQRFPGNSTLRELAERSIAGG